MTDSELHHLQAHLFAGGYDRAEIDKGLTAAMNAGFRQDSGDADECLSLVLGAILGEPGDRHPVEPGFVASLP